MSREDEIRKRLEGGVVPWASKDVIRFIEETDADLRYLLEKVERLEDLLYGACDSLDLEGCLNDSEDELYRWYHEYLAAQKAKD